MPRFSLKNAIQLTKKQLDKKKVEANRQLQDNNNALKDNIKLLDNEYKDAMIKAESIADEIKTAIGQQKKIEDNIKSLISKNNVANTQLIGKEAKLNDLSDNIKKLTKDTEIGKNKLETINKATKQANEVLPDIVKLKEELKSVSQELMKKKLELDDVMNQEGIIGDRVKNISDDYEKKIKPYETTLVKVKEKHDDLCKDYKIEIDKLEGEVKKIVSVITKHKGQLKNIEREIAAAKSIFEDNAIKIKNAIDENRQLKREKDILMREIADAKRKFEEWKVKAAEDVAKKVLKGRLDNIDKAGLKDILNAV